jgi:Leucine-rich repeat (LRR) protein
VSPEQYGFLQTDGRSDIYSLGVVLYYLLTGEITLKKENAVNKNLRNIISKCTAFSPKDRYQNAAALKRALVNYQKRIKQKVFTAAIAALSACLILTIGFAVGRYTDILRYLPVRSTDEYIFAEPLIEEAVRLTLGKSMDEPVLRKDLDLIKELYISGDEIVLSEREYERVRLKEFRISPENIESLEDIKYMPNLIKLCMNHQSVSDLSPLAEHRNLEILRLERCNISDVSSLLTVPNLRELFLFDNIVDDFSYFQEMKSLKVLIIGDNPLKNISELGDLSHIEALNLHITDIQSLDGIETMVNLHEIWLRETAVRDFSPLNDLPKLRTINISSDMEKYLDTLSHKDIEVIISD